MKFVVLALFVAVASANLQQKHTRQWHSVRVAANNMEKIQENGDLRGFFRDIICEGVDCSSVTLNFFMKNNGQCEQFSVAGNKNEGSEDYNAEFSGQNVFNFCHLSKNLMVFCFQNTDVNGLVTNVVHAAVRPGHKFNKADQRVYRELVKQHGIDKENILNIDSADSCSK